MPRDKAEWVLRFKQEASQYLTALMRELQVAQALALQTSGQELNQAEKDTLHELYRLAHTIRGSAAMVGENQISQLAQQLEQSFGKQLQTELRLTNVQCEAARVLIGQIQAKLG